MKRIYLIIITSLLFTSVYAQLDSIKYKVEAITSVSSADKLPFWLVSNKNGIIPEKRSDLLYVNLFKDYSSSNDYSGFDYSFGIDAATSYQYSSRALINQYYASLKYKKFKLLAGAKNVDVLYDGLSFVNNSIVMAGNARPYPKIEIGSIGYLEVPYTNGWLSVKGVFSNGWMLDDRYVKDVMVHHKNAYLRIGKEKGFSFELGVEHYAQWGGVSPNIEGQVNKKMPSDLDAFLRVLVAKEGGTYYNDMENALGNHIGQNKIQFNYNTEKYQATFFMRNMFEDRSQYFMKLFYKGITDIKDINYGLYFNIKNANILNSFIIEYYSTMSQGNIGHHSANTVVGYDSNFNNGIYSSGWTNYGRGFGIPLNSPTNILNNHRIRFSNTAFKAFNFGLQGEYIGLRYKFKATYQHNYGSITDGNQGRPFEEGMTEERIYSFNPPQHQQHYYLELMLPEGKLPFDIYTSLGLDIGEMYDDNFGMMVRIARKGNFSHLFGR